MEKEELEKLNSIARHDMLGPLSRIRSFGGLVKQKLNGSADPSITQCLDRIMMSSDRLTGVIGDFMGYLDLALLQFVQKERVQLRPVFDEAFELVSNPLSNTQFDLWVEDDVVVSGNKELLLRLFAELITNAQKFQPGDTRCNITARALTTDKGLVIALSDNGIGFDLKYLNRAMDVFHQLHPKGDYPGSGMGLAICKKIVQLHGWGVSVETEPDKGTTVFVHVNV